MFGLQKYFVYHENKIRSVNVVDFSAKLMFFSCLFIFFAIYQLKGGKFNV